jgi:hypothetical protein
MRLIAASRDIEIERSAPQSNHEKCEQIKRFANWQKDLRCEWSHVPSNYQSSRSWSAEMDRIGSMVESRQRSPLRLDLRPDRRIESIDPSRLERLILAGMPIRDRPSFADRLARQLNVPALGQAVEESLPPAERRLPLIRRIAYRGISHASNYPTKDSDESESR